MLHQVEIWIWLQHSAHHSISMEWVSHLLSEPASIYLGKMKFHVKLTLWVTLHSNCICMGLILRLFVHQWFPDMVQNLGQCPLSSVLEKFCRADLEESCSSNIVINPSPAAQTFPRHSDKLRPTYRLLLSGHPLTSMYWHWCQPNTSLISPSIRNWETSSFERPVCRIFLQNMTISRDGVSDCQCSVDLGIMWPIMGG